MSVITGEKTTFKCVCKLLEQFRKFYRFTDKCPPVRTLDSELFVYNSEIRFYRHMTLNHLCIIQATGYDYF